jgi:hypothetical protein
MIPGGLVRPQSYELLFLKRSSSNSVSHLPPPAAYAAKAVISAADIELVKPGMLPVPLLIMASMEEADPPTPAAWQPLQSLA